MKTSIIVLTYNRKSLFSRVLDALCPQMKLDDQLVVVDDGSTDNTEEMVRLRVPDVTYLRIPNNQGFMPATRINQGLEVAKHDMIWRLDSDCQPYPDCLEILKRHFRDDRLIAGAVSYTDPSGRILGSDHEYRRNFIQELSRERPEEYRHWSQTGELAHPVMCFGGNNCFSKQRAVQIGGFDSDFDGNWGAEDAWFAEKMMRKAGVKLIYAPGAAVIHHWHPQGGEHRDEERYVQNLELWKTKSEDMD